MVFIEKEKFGQLTRLTDERWRHIIERHPEVERHLSKIKTTIKNPVLIVENPLNQNEKYYHKYFKSFQNYLVVIIETRKQFIITAFISRKIKKGKTLWKKN